MSDWTERKLKEIVSTDLSTWSDGSLLWMRDELHINNEDSSVIDSVLIDRGIGMDIHFDHVGSEYFDFSSRRRRLPTTFEYGFKYLLFLIVKSFFLCILVTSIMLFFGYEHFAFIMSMFLSIVVVLITLCFSWFNLFYKPTISVCLRPFDDQKLSTPLKRFLRDNIGLRSHVYTLADKFFKHSTVLAGSRVSATLGGVALMLFMGTGLAAPMLIVALVMPWLRPSIRVLKLMDMGAFILLDREVEKCKRRTANNFFSGGTPFNIKCTYDNWKPCVQYLAHKSDFLIVDLSHIGMGVSWEIAYLKQKKLLRKCVFIRQYQEGGVYEHVADEITQIIKSLPVYEYDENGKLINEGLEKGSFMNRIETIVGM